VHKFQRKFATSLASCGHNTPISLKINRWYDQDAFQTQFRKL